MTYIIRNEVLIWTKDRSNIAPKSVLELYIIVLVIGIMVKKVWSIFLCFNPGEAGDLTEQLEAAEITTIHPTICKQNGFIWFWFVF